MVSGRSVDKGESMRKLIFLSPKSLSTNSRNSRPLSPTSEMTFTSASEPLAIMPRRIDFPTPLPAKIPILCPTPMGTKQSIDLIPEAKGSLILDLDKGLGGSA